MSNLNDQRAEFEQAKCERGCVKVDSSVQFEPNGGNKLN